MCFTPLSLNHGKNLNTGYIKFGEFKSSAKFLQCQCVILLWSPYVVQRNKQQHFKHLIFDKGKSGRKGQQVTAK